MIQGRMRLSRSFQEPRGSPFILLPASNMTACRPLDLAKKTDANGRDPVGHRAFLDTITSPYGKTAVCGKVVIGA